MNIAGLPAHPLLVHLAVVLVPIAVLAFVVAGWRSTWRRTYSWLTAGTAAVGAVGAFLAAQTGESLERALRDTGVTRVQIGDHPDHGDTAEIAAFMFALVAIALWFVDRYGDQWSLPSWSCRALYGIGAVVGAIAIVTMVIAGDSGARLVWETVGTLAPPR